MAIQQLTKDNFEEKVKNTAIIKFWASWCAPCKTLAPIYKTISEETKLDFFEVDVDEESKLAQRFDILSIPTIIVLENKKEVLRINGALPKEELKKRILSKT